MGTSDFAVPTLEKLIDQKEWEIITVVTQPDRPSGRGRKLAPSPVKIAAKKHRLPTLQPEKVREKTVIQHLKDLAPHCWQTCVMALIAITTPPDHLSNHS